MSEKAVLLRGMSGDGLERPQSDVSCPLMLTGSERHRPQNIWFRKLYHVSEVNRGPPCGVRSYHAGEGTIPSGNHWQVLCS